MATRPGGQKSISAVLDFAVQMQGISGAMIEFTGLSNTAQAFNQTMREIGNASKSHSEMILATATGEHKKLSEIRDIRTMLNEQSVEKLKLLKEQLQLPGQDPKDKKEALDQLTEELESRRAMAEQFQGLNQSAMLYGASLNIIGGLGTDAFDALAGGLDGVKNKEIEVGEGLGILKESFSRTLNIFKGIGKTFLGADEDKDLESKAELAFTDAAKTMKVKELRVATLLFDEALKSDKSPVFQIKDALKAGAAEKEVSPVEKAKDALKAGAGKDEEKGGLISKGSKWSTKLTKISEKATTAGTKMKQFSARMANMGKTGKALGPVVGKIGGGFTKLGSIAGKAGPVIAKLTAAIVAGGPIAWAAAAVVILTVGAALMSVAAAAQYLYKGFQLAIANMEAYRLVNYRALGSMHELMDATYDVSKATGLSNAQSMAAITALSKQGVTADELTKKYGDSGQALRDLAIMQGQFSRMTGASADKIATLQKRLMVGGLSMKNMQRTLDRTSMTMRKFGITGDDANAVMGTLSNSLLDMNAIYSESDINEYVDTMTGLAAAAKRAGVSMDVIGQIDSQLRGLEGGAATLMALSGSFDELIEGGAKAGTVDNLLEGYKNIKGQLDTYPKAMQDVALKQLGISGGMRAMLDAEKERREVMVQSYRDQGMSQDQANAKMLEQIALEKDTADLRQKAMDDYQGSINTLTQTLQDMFAPLKAQAAEAMLPFVEGLVKIVKAVGPAVMDMIGAAMQQLMAMGDAIWRVFEVLLPFFAVIGKAIQMLVVIGFKLGAVLWKVISAVLSLLKPFVLVLKLVAAVLMAIGDVIIFVFGGFLDAIGSILDAFSWLMDTLFSVETVMSALKYAAYALAIAFWPITVPLYLAYKAIMLIWDAVKYVFGAVKSIVGGAFGEIGGFFMEVWSLFSDVFGAVGKFFGEVFGDIGEFFAPLISAFETLWPYIKAIGLALVALFTPIIGPIMLVVGAIYAIGKVFKWLTKQVKAFKKFIFSSSFLHIGEGIAEILPFFDAIATAIGYILSPIKMIKAAFGAAFGFMGNIVKKIGSVIMKFASPLKLIASLFGLGGDDEEKKKPASAMSGIMEGLPADMQKAAMLQMMGVSTPMYTSKFDEDTKRSGKERSAELVVLQQETVALLSKILDKNDPDNKRAAEAMEKIANKAGEAKQADSFRSRKGFGEHVTQWWISK
jgi:hypothetical protein